MKRILVLLMAGIWAPLLAQTANQPPPEPKVPSVTTEWPGVLMKIPEVKRIGGNRLLLVVQIFATDAAPAGTLIGTPAVQDPNASAEDKMRPLVASPFSLQGSMMTEEHTLQKFPMLAQDPHGPIYPSSVLLASVAPGQSVYLTIQFALPPPPPPDNTGKIPKQTISVLLPKATGPITGVVVPPDGTKAAGP